MFRWSPFPFLRVSILFILGILLYEYRSFTLLNVWLVFSLSLIGYVIGLSIKHRLIAGVMGTICLLLLGWNQAYVSDPTTDPAHLSHHYPFRMEGFTGEVMGNVVEKGKYFRYDMQVSQVLVKDSVITLSGVIHLYLYKTDSFRLTPGSQLYIDYFFSEIPPPKNPAEFDYSNYVKRSGIYGQCFAHKDQIKLIKIGEVSRVRQWVYKIRENAKSILNHAVKEPRERQIAQALILGIKDYLDQEVKTAYASVGAMHVLAVSGLHVGIIYLILLSVMKPLRVVPYGSYLVFAGLIVGIWMYALITGFSPSVMRAATMFSVVSLKEISIRRTNIYNSLGLAALVILLIKPEYLFSVGFQLSFIAVLGIVFLYPKIYGLWQARGWLSDKVWSISCISIAAQLATFPLSMYYFNQFPVYFLISNLVVIPGATILLILGLITLIIGFVSVSWVQLPGFLLDGAIYTLNEAVFHIDRLPFSLITGLYITQWEVWLCYGGMVLFFLGLQYRSFITLIASSCLFILQLTAIHLRHWEANQQRMIVFYEIPNKTAIDLIDGKQASLLISEYQPSELELLAYQINPFRRTVTLPGIEAHLISWNNAERLYHAAPFRMMVWKGVRIVIISESVKDIELEKPVEADLCVVSADAVPDLRKLTSWMKADQFLFSSDCSAGYVRKMQFQSRKYKIPIHSLSKDGYWLLDLNKTPNP